MADTSVFYVYQKLKSGQPGQLVPATYLVVNGENITDPNWLVNESGGNPQTPNRIYYTLYNSDGSTYSNQNINGECEISTGNATGNASTRYLLQPQHAHVMFSQ